MGPLSFLHFYWFLGLPVGRPSEGPRFSGCDYRAGLHPLLEVKWLSAQYSSHGSSRSLLQPRRLHLIGAGCGRVIDQGKEHIESYFQLSSRNRHGMLKHEATHRKEKSFFKKIYFKNLKMKERKHDDSQN